MGSLSTAALPMSRHAPQNDKAINGKFPIDAFNVALPEPTATHCGCRHNSKCFSFGVSHCMRRKGKKKHWSTTISFGVRRSLHPALRATEAREGAAIRAMDRLVQDATEVRDLMAINHNKKVVSSTNEAVGALDRFDEEPTLEKWVAAKRASMCVAQSPDPWLVCDPQKADPFIKEVRCRLLVLFLS